MELIDPAYVEAADVKPEKRRNEWVKWLGAAACLCIVAVGVFAMPWGRSMNDISYVEPTISGDRIDENAGEKLQPENEIGGSATNSVGEVMTVPDITPVTEPAVDIYTTAIPVTGNVPNGMEAIDNGKPMISTYGEKISVPDVTVADGDIYLTEPLVSAMEHHGDKVNYRVLVELFREDKPISSGKYAVLDEADRLAALGYVVAYETVTKTEEHGEYIEANTTYYFTLHATYEQLQSFPASDDFGYLLMLLGERIDGTELPDEVAYNGGFSVNAE